MGAVSDQVANVFRFYTSADGHHTGRRNHQPMDAATPIPRHPRQTFSSGMV